MIDFLHGKVKSRVISGTEEGVFGWLSVNFLAKRLKGMVHEKEVRH